MLLAYQRGGVVEAIPSTDDAWMVGMAGLGLLLLVAVGEALRRVGVQPATSRRIVHVGVGLVVAATPYLFTGPGPIYVLATCFVIGNAVARSRQWWPGVHAARPKSVGTVTFPLAVFPALFLAWRPDAMHPWIITVAFLILAFADPIAAWVGAWYGRPRPVASATKSWSGSLAFAGSAWGISFTGMVIAGVAPVGEAAGISLVVAGAATMAEALGGRGWDNFFIVVASVVPLVVWVEQPHVLFVLMAGLLTGLLFAALTWWIRWLSRSGALAGGLLAASLIGLGGVDWAVPAFAFFVLSSLLSRVGRRRKHDATARSEKGAVRDAGQVYANGAAGWVLLVIYAVGLSDPVLYWGFLGAFAAAAADTWATELGTLTRGRPRLITSGRAVPPGTSGAVSGWGTLASGVGAASVGISAWAVAPDFFDGVGALTGLGLVVGVGVAGSMIDSLLGATLQAQYAGVGSELSERPSGAVVRGFRWMTNDRVNAVCTGLGALLGGIGAVVLGA